MPRTASPHHPVDADLEAEIGGVAASVGCELLHLELKGGVLRIFLDQEDGGVTLDHCQTVSRQVSALLDVHDFGKKKYVLEVSSPGLDRELYGPRDYQRFSGNLARVTFYGGEAHQKQTVVGRMVEFDGDRNILTLLEESARKRHEIPLADIQVARLEIEL